MIGYIQRSHKRRRLYNYRIRDIGDRESKEKEANLMEKGLIKEFGKFVPSVMKISRQMWIDYDKGADVVYISFEKPQHADDSVMEDNVIVHKRKNKIVGLTILHASEFGS